MNQTQKELLTLIWNYRFVTANDLAQALGKPNIQYIHSRLQILLQQGYITKEQTQYDARHHISALWYLTPSGGRALLKKMGEEPETIRKDVHSLYGAANVSREIKQRQQFLLTIRNAAVNQFDDSCRFMSSTELRGVDYYPRYIADGYLRVMRADKEHTFLFRLIAWPPSAAQLKKILSDYARLTQSEAWEASGQPIPALFFVCNHPQDAATIMRRIRTFRKLTIEPPAQFHIISLDSFTHDPAHALFS